jgi:hypothetical protein
MLIVFVKLGFKLALADIMYLAVKRLAQYSHPSVFSAHMRMIISSVK